MAYTLVDGVFRPLNHTPEGVLKEIKDNKYQVILQFTDVPGRFHGPAVPYYSFSEKSFQEGFAALDTSSIEGFEYIFESDGVLLPDPRTFAVLPKEFCNHGKTARLICDVHSGYKKEQLPQDPRYIAKRAAEAATNTGFDTVYVGPEAEFFILDSVECDTILPGRGVSYRINSKEAPWSTGEGYTIPHKKGYYPLPNDTVMDFRSELSHMLFESFNIPIEAHHHEVATGGQSELDMKYDALVNMADNIMTYKWAAKMLAKKHEKVVTFMPKPIFGDNGSGMHIHMSLWRDGENTFYDPKDEYAELSETARRFIAGILKHARSLSVFVNPTTNSYKRIVPGYEAPVFIAWSKGNRSAIVRVPVYHWGNPESKRVEFRSPDPSCNPYLAFAAILAAGLDGIKIKLVPPAPVDRDIYELPPRELKKLGIGQLPGSIPEALLALENDHEYLDGIFTEKAIERQIKYLEQSHKAVSIMPHPKEIEMYLDI